MTQQSNKDWIEDLFRDVCDVFTTGPIDLEKFRMYVLKYGYDQGKYKISNKRQVLRNCVDPEIGKYFLDNIELPDDTTK